MIIDLGHGLSLTTTATELAAARDELSNWCRDADDIETLAAMSDTQVARMIERVYHHGWHGFRADGADDVAATLSAEAEV